MIEAGKIYLIICVFTSFNAHFAFSEEAITWKECRTIALEHNPELKSAAEKVKQAGKDIDIDLSVILPQVDSDVTGKRAQSGTNKPANTYSYGMSASQLVFDGFKTSSEVSNSMKLFRAEQFNYDVVSSNIRLNLRSAFVNLMRAANLVFITENIATRRKQNLGLVGLRYEGGRENRGSLLTAEADMAQAEFDIEEARRSVEVSRCELLKELGIGDMGPLSVKPDFLLENDYKNKPDFNYISEMTPFIRELIAKKDAARYNLNSKEADFMPKVYVDGSLGRRDDSWPPRGDQWSAGFSMSLPLFEGGRRVAEVGKAKSQFKQAEFDKRSGRDTVSVTLERTWKDLQDAIANVAVRKKFLDADEERAKITRAQYATGLASFNDWIIIEDNLVRSQKAYLDAEANMLISEAYWIQAIGGTLDYD